MNETEGLNSLSHLMEDETGLSHADKIESIFADLKARVSQCDVDLQNSEVLQVISSHKELVLAVLDQVDDENRDSLYAAQGKLEQLENTLEAKE